LTIRDKNVSCSPIGRSAFVRPMREDFPAARTIAVSTGKSYLVSYNRPHE